MILSLSADKVEDLFTDRCILLEKFRLNENLLE